MSLILVHELGHFVTAILLKIEPDKIYIYPFGGVSKLNIDLNESIKKEFIVLIMGPIMQFIFSYLLINIFSDYTELINTYNYTIILFNLLPIYPLDGGKLLNLFISLYKSFRNSYLLSIYISYITVLIITIIYVSKNIKLNVIIIIFFLIYKISLELKNKNYVFDKFLLERYIKNYDFKKRKEVDNIKDFMRDKKHIVKKDNKYYTEKEILNKKFKNKY